MKLKATKTMAAALNKAAAAAGAGMTFTLEKLPERTYAVMVDCDIFAAEEYGDYNYNTGLFQAIRVSYPAEYYAMDNWLTTKTMRRIYTPGDYLEQFTSKVLEAFAI